MTLTTDKYPKHVIDFTPGHMQVLQMLAEAYFNGWGWHYVGLELQPKALEMACYGGYCIREIGNKTFFDPLKFHIRPMGILKLAENGLLVDPNFEGFDSIDQKF